MEKEIVEKSGVAVKNQKYRMKNQRCGMKIYVMVPESDNDYNIKLRYKSKIKKRKEIIKN